MPRLLIVACLIAAGCLVGCAHHHTQEPPTIDPAEPVADTPFASPEVQELAAAALEDTNKEPAATHAAWVEYPNWLDNHPILKGTTYVLEMLGLAFLMGLGHLGS